MSVTLYFDSPLYTC